MILHIVMTGWGFSQSQICNNRPRQRVYKALGWNLLLSSNQTHFARDITELLTNLTIWITLDLVQKVYGSLWTEFIERFLRKSRYTYLIYDPIHLLWTYVFFFFFLSNLSITFSYIGTTYLPNFIIISTQTYLRKSYQKRKAAAIILPKYLINYNCKL